VKYKITVKVEAEELAVQVAVENADREKLSANNPLMAAMFGLYDRYAPPRRAVPAKARAPRKRKPREREL
jgi:hypothetical protein